MSGPAISSDLDMYLCIAVLMLMYKRVCVVVDAIVILIFIFISACVKTPSLHTVRSAKKRTLKISTYIHLLST